MPRYRIEVEYDGTPFCGWQRQSNGYSVQEALEDAGAALSQGPAMAMGAGRTDSGVHAIAMTAHIDLEKEMPADTVRDGLNFYMRAHPATVLTAEPVSDDWHARFSCTQRHYLYRVLRRRARPALLANRVWQVASPLDVEAMAQGAAHLVGKHDFTTFRSANCQSASPVKTLNEISVTTEDEEIHFRLSARSFLHNQVRSFVGTLIQVGLGKWTPDDVKTALEAADRTACGPVAPASGLYFVKADYDEPI
ncbi:tRNA pseudouridine(38-40) synthase TruA [Parvularcula marina]|uniref:tRNA pseudouridine(38-40) synthase TruA n=1 Tax=Parvularcula marina TaxID=2292771 RepID=UPI0035159A94